eukprot:6193183-Pyramimonas_sp.AAC.1
MHEEVAQQAFLRQSLRRLDGVAQDYRQAEAAARTQFQSIAGAKHPRGSVLNRNPRPAAGRAAPRITTPV